MLRKLLYAICAVLFMGSGTVSAVEIGVPLEPSDILPKLNQIAGRKPMEKAQVCVYVFFDPTLPTAKTLLRMVDSVCTQSTDFKKKTEFYAVSRLPGESTKSMGLNGFILPIYEDKNTSDSIYREYTLTELVIPFAVVTEKDDVIWKGALEELDNVLHEIDKGTFSTARQEKLERMHKELQSAIQASLPRVISQSADKILESFPGDMLAIQAKLFVYETTDGTKEAAQFVAKLAKNNANNIEIKVLQLDYLVRTDHAEEFKQAIGEAFKDFSGTPASTLRLLSFVLDQAPFSWVPLKETLEASQAMKVQYAGKGGISEAVSLQFSAKANYLAANVAAAVADQKKATELSAGTEYEAAAKQDLSYYESVLALTEKKP